MTAPASCARIAGAVSRAITTVPDARSPPPSPRSSRSGTPCRKRCAQRRRSPGKRSRAPMPPAALKPFRTARSPRNDAAGAVCDHARVGRRAPRESRSRIARRHCRAPIPQEVRRARCRARAAPARAALRRAVHRQRRRRARARARGRRRAPRARGRRSRGGAPQGAGPHPRRVVLRQPRAGARGRERGRGLHRVRQRISVAHEAGRGPRAARALRPGAQPRRAALRDRRHHAAERARARRGGGRPACRHYGSFPRARRRVAGAPLRGALRMSNDSLFQRARRIIPAGVNSPVRAFGAVGGTPPFLQRASGAYVWDAEGRRYVDYVGSWGPMVVGHTHAAVVEAVQEAASRALSFGAPTEAEVELAETLCRLVPSLELVRLVSSGTEATMTALRLARGFTGRSDIVKFEGCYHGHADSLLVKAGSGALTYGNPSSA